MKNQNKISLSRILMISSQVLLSLFLGYWIYSQFIEKRTLLSEEIERGFRNSEEQVIDSMLARDIINPIINDSGYFSVTMIDSLCIDSSAMPISMEVNIDSFPHKLMHHTGNQEERLVNNSRIITRIEKMDDFGNTPWENDLQSTITVHAKNDSSTNLLFQGVKLLINTVGKFEIDQNNIYSFFSSSPDTVLLQKTFSEFLNKKYNSFLTNWKYNYKEEDIDNKLFFKSNLTKSPYGVSISGYYLYLLKSISTQIIFALALFIITALAFRLAFRNLKSQKRLLKLKNDFVSNITHELKTPVSTVKVALEGLLDFNQMANPKRTKEYLEIAQNEINRLDILVNQVLNNTTLEDNDTFISIEKINLILLISEVKLSMRSLLESNDATIIFNPGKEEIYVQADRLHLRGVIINLIDNSIKYNSKSPIINITIEQNSKNTKLLITDNGIGIPKEFITKVFDKFFRVPSGNEHNVKGYGLGLNYASLVMQHHKGSINVNNNTIINGGCTFTLSLPNKHE